MPEIEVEPSRGISIESHHRVSNRCVAMAQLDAAEVGSFTDLLMESMKGSGSQRDQVKLLCDRQIAMT